MSMAVSTTAWAAASTIVSVILQNDVLPLRQFLDEGEAGRAGTAAMRAFYRAGVELIL
jgi:hypothetical protein